MKLKTLFLGTAAAFAVTGGAQAADLALAVEPIDYVKVCDAFGTGYAYIPGTDVCLKIGGYAQMDIWFYDNDRVGNYFNVSNAIAEQLNGENITGDPLIDNNPAIAAQVYAADNYSQSWEFTSEYGVNFTAKSMSDLGPIVTFFEFRGKSNNYDGTAVYQNAYLDSGYGAIGPVMFGYTTSTFDPGGGYTYDGAIRSDSSADQVRLSYLMGTWGIMLGLEDPRDRYSGPKNATGDYPDIVLALTGGVGGFDVKLSGVVTDRTSGTGWALAAAGEAEFGAVKFKLSGAYSDNAASYVGGSNCFLACDDGEWWSIFGSVAFDLSANLSVAGTLSYIDGAGGASYQQNATTTAAAGIYYAPSGNSEIGLEFLWSDTDNSGDSWGIHNRWKTSF